ncbi:MAG: sialate O-acetylesterase, partial [Phocaeicola sp.]
MRITFLIICLFFTTLRGYSQLELSAIFSNGMVLQQNSSVKIWGWSNAGDEISVCADWNVSDTVKARVDNAGRWECELRTIKSGGPYNVTIQGSSQNITLSDVLLGEVWLCSGQSNMEWSVNHGIDNGEHEAANAAYNTLRIFHMPKRGASTPQVNCSAKWEVSSPESMRKTSSTAYFFGRYLSEKLGVPVGIIVSAWGGTPAEVWTPTDVINNNSILSKCKLGEYPWWPIKPGALFNQMINPVIPFKLAGCI